MEKGGASALAAPVRRRGSALLRDSQAVFALVLLAALAAVPLLVSDPYVLQIFVLAFVWLIVVAAWDLITGYAGIFSFGQVAFLVIGAYASGLLSTQLGVNPWLSMLLAGSVTALFAVGIGLPCLRVRGVYIALVTYALHLALPTLILRGEGFGTGGAGGLLGIPPLSLGGYRFSPLDQVPWYYTGLAIAAVCVYLIYFRIVRSDFGLAMTAFRDAIGFAKSLGVDEARTTLVVFALSGFFTGVAGGYYAHYTGSVSQDLLGMTYFLLFLVMLTVGGMGRFPGAVVGVFAVTFANEYLRVSGSLRMVILGSIIVVAILVMPEGSVQWFVGLVARTRRRRTLLRSGDGAGASSQSGGVSETLTDARQAGTDGRGG
jgi:branched-chain amino acid transport system permease protein